MKIKKLVYSIIFITLLAFLIFSNKSKAVVNTKTIEDGLYYIETALNTNMMLDVTGAQKTDKTNVQIYYKSGLKNQKWYIKSIGNGYYQIKAAHSGKYLDVRGAGKANGTNVQQHSGNNVEAQKWIIKDLGNGYCNIISKVNGLYLNVAGHAKNNTNVCTWKGNGTANQKFKLARVQELKGQKTIEPGYYQIQSALKTNLLLDINNASRDNCANVQVWNGALVTQEKFYVRYLNDGYYLIENRRSGKVLDVKAQGMLNGTNVYQYAKNNTDAQKWVIKDAGNGYYNIISKANELYLHVSNSKNGANVCTWSGNGSTNQKFKFIKIDELKGTKTIENGVYEITTPTNKVLDVTGASTANSANIQIFSKANVQQQKFYVTYLNNGYYKITAVHSGKTLDVAGQGARNGTNVQQYSDNNTDAQKWVIKSVGGGYYNIISKANELYLEVKNGSSANKTNVYTWQAKSGNSQKFKFIKVKTLLEKEYMIASAGYPKKAMEVANSSKSDGGNIQYNQEDICNEQIFTIKYVDLDYCKIISKHSGKVLTESNGNVIQSADKSLATQLWKVTPAYNGFYYVINKSSGNYVDSASKIVGNKTNIKTNKSNALNTPSVIFKDPIISIKGTYGKSGLKHKKSSQGSNLEYYQYGHGPNVYFATFAVHGFEDEWKKDGKELSIIADDFYNKLIKDKNSTLANNWTIYIFPMVNPDGVKSGTTNNGPGRTSLYSSAPKHKGVDINRCWHISGTTYKKYTDDRNYNGTAGFQAYEAAALKTFLLNHKAKNGQTVLVDLHGWLNETIGNEQIASYYKTQYGITKHIDTYGQGYLVNWARATLGAKASLIELPYSGVNSHADVVKKNFSGKYITATINMLNALSSKTISYSGNNKIAIASVGSTNSKNDINVTDEEQYKVAMAGILKNAKPTENDIKNLDLSKISSNGVWIDNTSKNVILNLINSNTNSVFTVNANGYLVLAEESSQKNKYDELFVKLMKSDKKYVLCNSGKYYERDIVDKNIVLNEFEALSPDQTYDYVENGKNMIIFIPENKQKLMDNKAILDSLIELLK